MFDQIRTMRLAIVRLTETLDAMERQLNATANLRHRTCITRDLPPGYDTVLGYLAKYHPECLDAFDYGDPTITQRDGFWLAHRAKEAGLTPVWVEAPAILQERDIPRVRAYPVELLAKRWG